MCSRIEAIQIVITNVSGTKHDLVRSISLRHYEEFISSGLIREPVKVPGHTAKSSRLSVLKEWVATPLAFERANSLNIRAVKSLKFGSSNNRSLRSIVKAFSKAKSNGLP